MKENKHIKEASSILDEMLNKFMENISPEQWAKIKAEIRQARKDADGVDLDGEELEATAKANVLTRLASLAKKI